MGGVCWQYLRLYTLFLQIRVNLLSAVLYVADDVVLVHYAGNPFREIKEKHAHTHKHTQKRNPVRTLRMRQRRNKVEIWPNKASRGRSNIPLIRSCWSPA